jgi:hypothetical protein
VTVDGCAAAGAGDTDVVAAVGVVAIEVVTAVAGGAATDPPLQDATKASVNPAVRAAAPRRIEILSSIRPG